MTISHPTTVPDCLLERVARSPTTTAFWRHTRDGWTGETWESVATKVQNLAGHLIRLGLLPGDRVAIMMPTTIEWELCHLAALTAGCVVVGIDAYDAPDNIRHILSIVTPRALCVARQDQLQPLLEQMPTPPLFSIVHGPASGDCCHTLPALLEQSATPTTPRQQVRAQDLATIVFTSGSSGQPKGIAYRHDQICLASEAILDRFSSVGEGARFVCWLPLSNLFQRMINLCGMIRGGESYFVDNPVEIIDRLPGIGPTLFIGVPRFFEKLHKGIEDNIAKRSAWLRRGIGWARRTGWRYRQQQRSGRRPGPLLQITHRVADELFLRRIRSVLGPDLQFMVSGSAPLPIWLMEDLHAIGWLVLEAYGTSENVVPIAINAPDSYRFGSVGRPLPQNEIQLAEDSELLVRGRGVFGGYFGDANEASPLDADGFLHTGDYADQDADGFIWLTGRKSDIFKTSTGRRVAPVSIEARLKQLQYVEQAVVLGRNRPVPVALLCLDLASLPGAHRDQQPIAASILKRIADDVTNVCANLPEHDRPAGLLVTQELLTIAAGDLTSNLKLRRAPIETRFRAQLDALYAELASGRINASLLIRETS